MRVAIVGSGVSGLAAAWLLNRHSDHEVHLYEADSRPGGHANTVRVAQAGRVPVDVDSGFIVFNPSTYPNFLSFLHQHPTIHILPTEMTFSVSRDLGSFEWAGGNLFTVFCQPKRVFDPEMWKLLYDVLKFNACARRILKEPVVKGVEMSIGEYLEREGYSASFRDNYLIPMTAAVWSTPPDLCALDFPARTLVQFMHNHHLLQITGKPSWLTIQGGSKQYVNTILSMLPDDCLRLSNPVRSITSNQNTSQLELMTEEGKTESYDHVIMACHSDDTLRIMSEGEGITEDEKRILGGFRWNKNEVVVHSDEALMPKSRIAWSCWNYLTQSAVDAKGRRKANNDQVALTYWMNDLQHISTPTHGPIFATLNPPFPPDPSKTYSHHQYSHPVLDSNAVRLQAEIDTIQGKRGIWYAGAWMKYGFHEDGWTAGLKAAVGVMGRDVSQKKEGEYGVTGKEANGVQMNGSAKGKLPPIEILSAERSGAHDTFWILCGLFFDVLEIMGLRTVVGFVLGLWLSCLRWIVGHFIELP